jgi:Na+/melibiose symporter-like transporter
MVNASVGDFVTEPDKRASYIATNMALVNGGYAVITLFAGQIAARNEGANWPNAYWFLFAITLVIMIVFIILMPKVKKDEDASTSKSPQMEQEQANIVHKRSLPTIFFLMVLIAFIFTISYFTFSLNYSSYIITENQLGTSVQTSLAASIMTAFGLIAGFTYKYWAKLLKKWLVPVAYLSASIGLFTMLFVNKSIIGVYVAAALIGLGNNLAYPYITAKIMTLVSPKLISLATSLYMAFINLGTFISLYVIAFLGNLAGGGISGSITVAAFGALASAVAAVFIYVFAL